jgi:glycosyltransferase involved in cell wall biosynthesis
VLEKYGLREGYVFYPAQFWPHKNHVNLLEAIATINTQSTDPVQLVLTGADHGNESFLRARAQEMGVENDVQFLGFVESSEIAVLYRNAACLAFVSYFGPDNIPPLEAFQLGCPVIAADVPGAREQLGDAAVFVNPSSPPEIAGAIDTIRSDPGFRAELVQRGTWRLEGRLASDYVDSINRVLNRFEPIRRNWSARHYGVE